MTIVEPVADLTIDEAQAITSLIRTSIFDLEVLIVRAFFGRAWVPLGYDSWDDYLEGEFKKAPLALPREDRRFSVLSLRQQGLSLPAIAAATGVSESTASRDVQLAQNGQVDLPARSTGLDGKERPATRPTAPSRQTESPPAPRETCPTCGQPLPA